MTSFLPFLDLCNKYNNILSSDSTDDDKIVKYDWDVVSGPLQDKSITGDTAILTLTELVPGNYTLK